MDSPEEKLGEAPKTMNKKTKFGFAMLAALFIGLVFGTGFLSGSYWKGEIYQEPLVAVEADSVLEASEYKYRYIERRFDHPDEKNLVDWNIGASLKFAYFGNLEDSLLIADALKKVAQISDFEYISIETNTYETKPSEYITAKLKERTALKKGNMKLSQVSEQKADTVPVKEALPKKYFFKDILSVGAKDIAVVALQTILNRDPATALAGDVDGHGAPGREICSFGPMTKDALIRDQKIHKEDIRLITGKDPKMGVFDEVMIVYYNHRIQNLEKYVLYQKDLAPSCIEQKKRIALGP